VAVGSIILLFNEVNMHRPEPIYVRHRPDEELAELASRAVYLGSPEHKNRRWWGGLPEAGNRADWQTTTICPLTTKDDRDRATGWVQSAIRSRQCRFYQGDINFPKAIWHQADGQIWMGYRTNDGLGEYKGWPIEEEERDAIFD
jgi:hypothetical protein